MNIFETEEKWKYMEETKNDKDMNMMTTMKKPEK